MHNKSLIGYEHFRKIRRETVLHLSRHHHSEDSNFYVQAINDTLHHLDNIYHIRIRGSASAREESCYDLHQLFQYDLSTVEAVKNLSFTYYKIGEQKGNYSLKRWLVLHANFIVHEKWLHQIATRVRPLIWHSHDNNSSLKRSLDHLYHAVYIQDRHKKMAEFCYPNGFYLKELIDQYDLTTMQNLLTLRVEHVVNSHTFLVLARSVQEGIDKILRRKFYIEIQARIASELSQYSQDHSNPSMYQDLFNQALWRLEQVIRIRNDLTRDLALGTMDSPFYYDNVMHYDLRCEENLWNLRIHTYHSTGRLQQASLNDIANQLKAPRLAKCLFNAIYHHVMSAVYHLQELVEKETTEEPLKIDLRIYIDQLASALNGLYLSIRHHYGSDVAEWDGSPIDYSSADALLNIVIKMQDGSDSTLFQIIYDNTYFTPDLLQILQSISIDEVLNHAKANVPVVMQSNMYSSRIKSKKLCALIEKGNLEEIKQLKPTTVDVNLLIDLPLEMIPKDQPSASFSEFWHKLSITNLIKDINVISDTVKHGPILLFLGRYNALILAVCYRHYHVVDYFINTLQANPDIKGGRKNDYSARDCANFQCNMLKIGPPDERISSLLQQYRTGKRSAVIHGTFFYPDEEKDSYVSVDNNEMACS